MFAIVGKIAAQVFGRRPVIQTLVEMIREQQPTRDVMIGALYVIDEQSEMVRFFAEYEKLLHHDTALPGIINANKKMALENGNGDGPYRIIEDIEGKLYYALQQYEYEMSPSNADEIAQTWNYAFAKYCKDHEKH